MRGSRVYALTDAIYQTIADEAPMAGGLVAANMDSVCEK
jgi:hypothetical protein